MRFADSVRRVESEAPGWHAEYLGYQGQLRHWVHTGALTDPAGHVVWDMGCGWGAFSLAFLALGAKAVLGSDTVVDRSRMPAALFETEGIRIVEGDTVALASSAWAGPEGPTLLFMHLVSEHVADLPSLLRSVRSNCPTGTRLFIHHDNYYQPVGHHDHGFLFYRPATHTVESNASPCWESPDKCEASATHRDTLRRERAWQWSDASEATRDPGNCEACNYRIRAQPWAHLIAADRFTRVFPEPFFTAALNKITPFQLRQHLIEAGFDIESDVRDLLANRVPERLEGKFTEADLRTFTVTVVAVSR